MRIHTDPVKLLDAKSGTGAGNPFYAADYRHISLSLFTTGNANFTLKIAGTMVGSIPDPTSSAAVDNHFGYIWLVNLDSGSEIQGDTGITSSGTDLVENYVVNTDYLTYIRPHITAHSAGDITLWVVGSNDY
jgi:hypothetical protein